MTMPGFLLALCLLVAVGDARVAWDIFASSSRVKIVKAAVESLSEEPAPQPHWRLLGSAKDFWGPNSAARHAEAFPFIYNGKNATKNIVPAMVSIQVKAGDNVFHLCGGSLGALNKVVTAAHCLEFLDRLPHQVALGYHVISEGLKNPNSQVIKVASGQYHDQYLFTDVDTPYDMAVMTLAENAEIVPGYVEIMKYTTKLAAELAGSKAFLIGWGKLEHDGNAADTLQYGDYKVVTIEECRDKWPGFRISEDRNICAISTSGTGDCMGDSGGPLLNPEGTQIGIVSWGHSKCNPKFPAVFISPAFYKDWVTF